MEDPRANPVKDEAAGHRAKGVAAVKEHYRRLAHPTEAMPQIAQQAFDGGRAPDAVQAGPHREAEGRWRRLSPREPHRRRLPGAPPPTALGPALTAPRADARCRCEALTMKASEINSENQNVRLARDGDTGRERWVLTNSWAIATDPRNW